MLTRDDNELLTNIDRGSPMGEVFSPILDSGAAGR